MAEKYGVSRWQGKPIYQQKQFDRAEVAATGDTAQMHSMNKKEHNGSANSERSNCRAHLSP